MTKQDALTCEVQVDGTWRAMGLDEAAVYHPADLKRCPACHGRVMILGAYSGPNVRRSLSHRKSHSGCPRQADIYSGTPSSHPQALV